MSKFRRTLTRIVLNDRTVYRDLKNYAAARVVRANGRFRHRMGKKSSDVFTSINLSIRQRTEYGVHILFEQSYYQEQSGETFETYDDALQHFEDIGQEAGLNPHPLFDTKYYIAQKPKLGDMSVIEHYFQTAYDTGFSPSPYFDTQYYIKAYPWTKDFNPLGHFLIRGYVDKHNPFEFFDTGFYFQNNVKKLEGIYNPILHYVSKGWRQGIKPHPLIDVEHIALQIAPETPIEEFKEDPLLTFLVSPAKIILNPNPYFDVKYFQLGLKEKSKDRAVTIPKTGRAALQKYIGMRDNIVDPSPRFSERRYKEANPDLGNLNGLYHYLRHGFYEGRICTSSMNSAANPQLEAAIEIDPVIVAPRQDIVKATIAGTPRLYDPSVQGMIDLVLRRGNFDPDIIYLMPGFYKGGAEKYGAKLTKALSGDAKGQKVLVITTDSDVQDTRDWIADRTNIKVLPFETKQLGLKPSERVEMLGKFLMWCKPSIVINNNSATGWAVYKRFGKGLSNVMRLSATLFCYEFDAFNRKVGYARDYIRDTAEYLDAVFVDNKTFGRDLIKDFSLGPAGQGLFKVLHQPFEGQARGFVSTSGANRPRVLWAARIAVQKNVALLRDIALDMPDVDFVLWSVGTWDKKLAGGSIPKNVEIIVEETTFEEIAQRNFQAFLLTSSWEGLPTTLIEASLAGLPIVSSNVGGVSDLVTETTGWLAPSGEKEVFVTALRECLSNRDMAAQKVALSQAHVQKQHSEERYLQKLKTYGLLPANNKPIRKSLKFPNFAAKGSAKASKSAAKTKSAPKLSRLEKTSLDATIVVNGHREGAFIIPTLQSTFRAFEHTQKEGFSCEILIFLDNPDDITLSICRGFVENNAGRIVTVDVRDLGLARNAAVRAARGEYVAFMDGDDMMTKNWISQGIRTGKVYGPDVAMHPAMNYIFGNGDTYIYLHCDMDSPEFSLAALIGENYWTAISMARRDLYLKFPYDKNALKEGLAYEDWSWNSLTIANGVRHKIVHDTAHFIRRKESGSLLQQTAASESLPRLYHLKYTDITT